MINGESGERVTINGEELVATKDSCGTRRSTFNSRSDRKKAIATDRGAEFARRCAQVNHRADAGEAPREPLLHRGHLFRGEVLRIRIIKRVNETLDCAVDEIFIGFWPDVLLLNKGEHLVEACKVKCAVLFRAVVAGAQPCVVGGDGNDDGEKESADAREEWGSGWCQAHGGAPSLRVATSSVALAERVARRAPQGRAQRRLRRERPVRRGSPTFGREEHGRG